MGLGAISTAVGVATGRHGIFHVRIRGVHLHIVWIGIVVDVARGVVLSIVGEDGLLFMFSNVGLRVASAEGAWAAIR